MSIPRFGVTRPVPVNLLMVGAFIGGAAAALSLTREFFPQMTPESAVVTLPYPGATPAEVEEGLAMKVEDVLADLDEVERMTTTLAESGGGIVVEFRWGIDNVDKAVDKVERAVDALTDLPEEAERIRVTELEARMPVIMVSLYGPADEEAMKRGIRRIRDDLKSLPGMGEVLTSGVRDYEIRVDVSAAALLEHRISLPQLSASIGNWMADVPGGSVRSGVGDISVRTTGVPERAEAIRQIVVKATPQGQALRVGDLASVREDYVDQQLITRFGRFDERSTERRSLEPSVSLTVFKTGDQDAVEIAEMVRAYVAGRRGDPFEGSALESIFGCKRKSAYELGVTCPDPLPGELETHSDLARFIEGRLDLLIRNARWGALLVFGTLLVFLNWRVAVWVGIGLVISLCGTLVMMNSFGITLNLITMFGMIVVLGLLVDDAIVVAENIQARYDRQEPALVAAIKGTEQVFWPVVATVLTSIVAFMPLRFIQGQIGDLIGALPVIVSFALMFSLVEAVLILPSHMGHSLLHRDRSRPGRFATWLRRYESSRDRLILGRIVPGYGRLLASLLRYRYATLAAGLSVLIASMGIVVGGRIGFTFFPASDSETIIVDLRMPIGTPIERTASIVRRIETAAADQPETKCISTIVGYQANLDTGQAEGVGGHLAQMFIELKPIEQRERESSQVIASIRQELGVISDVERLRYSEIGAGPGGPDITIVVTGNDETQRDAVVGRIRGMLADSKGVYDIADDASQAQREVQVQLKPSAAGLGLNVADVATQVRGALFGLEPHVFSAKREDIKVRVRLDERSRRSLYAIEHMYLITPQGRRVPLGEVAEITEGSSYSLIRRLDRRRAVTVTADTAPSANPEQIMAQLQPRLDELRREHPDVGIELGGRQRELRRAFETLPLGFMAACVLIYIILAWLFGSYTQPIAVMLAIPFSLIGVIWGHLLMGYQMTFLSLIGFVALSGIVVNDSLILVEFFNTKRKEGMGLTEALIEAGGQRLRPIFLTTITTVLALSPLMLEQSFQAKFLIPMAISISFGLISATGLILIVLPCIIVIIDDVKAAAYYLWTGRSRTTEAGQPQPSLDALIE